MWCRIKDLVLGPVGSVLRGAPAFGETCLAGAAREQAILAVLAESVGDGEISGAGVPEVGALGILATEPREVVHGAMRGLERGARKRLETLLPF